MKKYLFGLVAFAVPMIACADSIYLNCKLINGSGFNMAAAYKVPPKNLQNQFISDAIAKGVVGYLTSPPTAWEINFSDKTIVSPEESHKIFKIHTLTSTMLEGEYFDYHFSLNRIDLKLKYTVNINKNLAADWEKDHGGKLPSFVSYTYTCTSSDKPKI